MMPNKLHGKRHQPVLGFPAHQHQCWSLALNLLDLVQLLLWTIENPHSTLIVTACSDMPKSIATGNKKAQLRTVGLWYLVEAGSA